MNAGKLDKRLQLLEPVFVVENERTNSKRKTYAVRTTVWARLIPGGVVERVIGRSLVSSSSVLFSIRYRRDIDATWKVALGSTSYRIVGLPEPPSRGQETLLECEKEDPALAGK